MFGLMEWGHNSYAPSHFILRLDLPIEVMNLQDDVYKDNFRMSLFLHEYIHFLQDISTRYGLMKTSNLYLYAHSSTYEILNARKKKFKTPIHLPYTDLSGSHCVFANREVLEDYLGTGVVDNLRNKTIKIVSLTKKKVSQKFYKYSKWEIIVKNLLDGSSHTITLGGEILCECMAYLVEQNYADAHGIQIPPTSPYPYLLPIQIVKRIYPEIAEDKRLLFFIIDQCLYRTYNPGECFMEILNYLKNEKCHEKMDRIGLVLCFFDNHLSEAHTFKDVCKEVGREVNNCLKDEYFRATKDWLIELYNRAEFLRQCPRWLLSFMTTNGPDKFASDLRRFVFGTPIVLNDEYLGSIQPPTYRFNVYEVMNIHPEYFAAMGTLAGVFAKGAGCSLKMFCSKSNDAKLRTFVRADCDKPWLSAYAQITKEHNLCPFSVIWKHWGLTNQSPKDKK
ncbi:MAG: hypothetical protein ACI4TK_12920 [Agathobacter sp.]